MNEPYPHGAKSTWQAQADAIVAGDVTLSESEIPKLLDWLQDMNWPGAKTIAKFLVQFGPLLNEPVRTVLRSKDALWISWVLLAFKNEFDQGFWAPLASDLKLIAQEYDEEGAQISAITILAKWKLSPLEELRPIVQSAMNLKKADPEDFAEVYRLLSVS